MTKGSYAWHKHENTDDFFLVLKGDLMIEMRDRVFASARRNVRRSVRWGRQQRRGSIWLRHVR